MYTYRPGLQAYCASHGGDAPKDSNPPGVDHVTLSNPPPVPSGSSSSSGGLFGGISLPSFGKRQSGCKKNILIYVKGTFEFGDLGQTQGPSIQQKLDSSKWDVVGVEYDNSIDNDYCLGLPGGISARQVLAQQVQKCPNSNFAMAGYSQGAMVVRHVSSPGDRQELWWLMLTWC
ncbi:MAG: cutinase family protein [Terriglobus roseus]|nr:cutinase family protein [Terriglobus roseus]